MTKFHFVTYCTHDIGTFQELKNNTYGYDIKVIGWGKPWNGFLDKYKGMMDHISEYEDEDVVCFVDGFDVLPNKSVDIFKERFFKMKSPIIASKNMYALFSYKIFGDCEKGYIANSGMYCGYVKAIRNILKDMLKDDMSVDDQRNLNTVCRDHNVKVDDEYLLFYNIPYSERIYKKLTGDDACFLGYPGRLDVERLARAPKEYLPFIWKELIAIFIITLLVIKIFQMYNNKYARILLIAIYIVILYYLTK